MTGFPISVFFVLLGFALLGAAAILPYSFVPQSEQTLAGQAANARPGIDKFPANCSLDGPGSWRRPACRPVDRSRRSIHQGRFGRQARCTSVL